MIKALERSENRYRHRVGRYLLPYKVHASLLLKCPQVYLMEYEIIVLALKRIKMQSISTGYLNVCSISVLLV